MRISIKGGTEEQKLHAKQFCKFFAKKFFKDELSKTLSVKIEHHPYVHDVTDLADCVWTDEEDPPKKYHIQIFAPDDILLVNYLRTLAHEMVHVKQYAKRELRQLPSTNNEVCKWLGKRYEWEMHYWDRPWEIDAHGREKGLVIDYGKAQNMGTTLQSMF